MTLIEIDWASSDAVYEQIARQIRGRIIGGELQSGSALPSVRTLASDLGVSLNTVARAYRILEEGGFLNIRDRAGAVVADPAPRAQASVRAAYRAEMRDLVGRMRQAGIDIAEIRQIVADETGGGGAVRRRGRI